MGLGLLRCHPDLDPEKETTVKLAFCADPHIGNHQQFGGALSAGMNERCRIIVDTLQRAYKAAVAEGCEGFYILGDLFDTEKPTPQMIAAVQEIFGPDNEDVGAIVGNHDQHSYTASDHALAPLADHISVFEAAAVAFLDRTALWMVPYEPGPAKEWLPKRLLTCAQAEQEAEFRPNNRALLIHLGIESSDTVEYMRGHDDAIEVGRLMQLMKQHHILNAFAGNWHRARRWSDEEGHVVVQAGSLAPVGFRDEGADVYGRLVIFDTRTLDITIREIPGPRFIKTSIAAEEPWTDMLKRVGTCLKQGETGWAWHLQVTASPSRVRELLGAKLGKGWRGIRVVPNDADNAQAARQAASAAKSATNKDAAVDAYIRRMALDQNVSREKVAQRCRSYLHGN